MLDQDIEFHQQPQVSTFDGRLEGFHVAGQEGLESVKTRIFLGQGSLVADLLEAFEEGILGPLEDFSGLHME